MWIKRTSCKCKITSEMLQYEKNTKRITTTNPSFQFRQLAYISCISRSNINFTYISKIFIYFIAHFKRKNCFSQNYAMREKNKDMSLILPQFLTKIRW